MDNKNLSGLRLDYKQAADDWVASIRGEESLATSHHSMTAMEQWDEAHLAEQDAATAQPAAASLPKTVST